jgi:hypothetical protein
VEGRHPRTVRRRVLVIVLLVSRCAFSALTVSIIAGVLTTTSTRRDVLVKVDVHGGGLDGGSGLGLVHVISRPRCEHGLRQQRREPVPPHYEGARLS